MLKIRKLRISLYCYDSNGKVYKKLDSKPVIKLEEVGSRVIISLSKQTCLAVEKSEIANIFIHQGGNHMMQFLTVKRISTKEYIYINRPCELLGITNDVITIKVGGRVEQFHTDFYYWFISNFRLEIGDQRISCPMGYAFHRVYYKCKQNNAK